MCVWKLHTVVVSVVLSVAATSGAADAQVTDAAPIQGLAMPSALSGAADSLDRIPGPLDALVNDLDYQTLRSEYWIGLSASPPSPALRAQLTLPKDQGLLVEALQPDGPAAKAGVQRYDILLKGNDKTLSNLHDLLQLIDQVKDGKLNLDLLRAGKHETLTVTPAKRPAHGIGEFGMLRTPEGRGLDFRIIRPGQILPPGRPTMGLPSVPGGGPTSFEITVRAKSTLADGSKVEITQSGSEPAKIVVTHDKDTWEGTSSDLSKIPEKLRPEVEKLLHPVFDHNVMFSAPGLLAPPLINSPAVVKRLSDLQKQVDELRQTINALQQGKATEKSAPKPE